MAMVHLLFPHLVLVLFSLNGSLGTSIQGCKFCYTVQPVEQLSDCNPYTNLNGISTKCTINGPKDTLLQIKWFNSSTNSLNGISQEIMNHSSTVYSIQETHTLVGDNRLETQSQLFIYSLSIGQYWCQVFYGNEGLLDSPRLEIGTSIDYERNDQPCEMDTLIQTGLEKCDNIIENGASYSVCPTILSSSSSSITVFNTVISDIPLPSVSVYSCLSTSCTSYEFELTASTENNDISSSLLTEILTTTLIPVQTVIPSDSGLNSRQDSFHLWLYIVAALTGLFAILIIILTGICIGLCVTKPNRMSTTSTQYIQQEPSSRPESGEFNDNASRPQTSMTIHTDIPMTPLPPELDNTSAYYDALELEQDYEDLDERDKQHFVTPLTAAQNGLPRYHEQGPSAGTLSHPPLQPTYSEIGEATSGDTLSKHTFGMSHPSTGYGKLDHSRPRQNYYPKRDSPLLSGYRKLEHIQERFKATTLPHNPQPGYANIELSGATPGSHHLRSISLPNSEYSNLNPCPYNTEPSTLTHEQSSKKKYANFDIIEAHMGVEEVDLSPHMSQCSDDYHMLEDATVEQHQQGEYEFLPTYEEEEQSPDSLFSKSDHKISYRRHVLGSLGKDPLGEQISVASSQSSSDFTGPFFFPHMVNPPTSPEPSDHHIYKPLDISTMEPEQSYTSIKKNYQ